MPYTFGDNDEASRRLRRLAEVYESETRELLEQIRNTDGQRRSQLAVDLGCGPGWSTQLLHTVLQPQQTVGLELSERYVIEARANHPELNFLRHDILQTPFPLEAPDMLLCRFLLTHLPSPHAALMTWAEVAAPRATLAIHETEELESAHPALNRYYELVREMQRHYGQILHVGGTLDASFKDTAWQVRQSRQVTIEKAGRDMAQLHLSNLRTWGRNEYALKAFDRRELDKLEIALSHIASGDCEAGVVHNTARQIIAQRK